MLDKLLNKFEILSDDIKSLVYVECGCCGRRKWDVQRRVGLDFYLNDLRELYGVLCDECFADLRSDNDSTD